MYDGGRNDHNMTMLWLKPFIKTLILNYIFFFFFFFIYILIHGLNIFMIL